MCSHVPASFPRAAPSLAVSYPTPSGGARPASGGNVRCRALPGAGARWRGGRAALGAQVSGKGPEGHPRRSAETAAPVEPPHARRHLYLVCQRPRRVFTASMTLV